MTIRPSRFIPNDKSPVSSIPSIHQLEVYDAIFCLEYDIQPGSIDHELRIYQSDQVLIHEPEIDDIAHIMDRIVVFDKRINEIKLETL